MISNVPDSATAEKSQKPTAVWMVFLVSCCSTMLFSKEGTLNSHYTQCLFSTLEQFLKSGASSEIFFLVHLNDDEGKPLKDNPSDDELLSISLQQFLSLSNPPNLESIHKLLLEREKRSLWSKATSSISTFFMPHSGSSSAAASKYQPFGFNELGREKYTLHSVCSGTEQLLADFSVRIY
jgi:hypothetical protein